MGWFDWFSPFREYPPAMRALIRKRNPAAWRLARVTSLALSVVAIGTVLIWVWVVFVFLAKLGPG